MVKRKIGLGIALLSLIGFQGCGLFMNTKGYQPMAIPESKRAQPSTEDAHALSWLIREILPSNRGDREQLEAEMSKERRKPSSAPALAGTAAALATGAPLSQTGVAAFAGAGLATRTLGALSRGHYYRVIGRLFLDTSAQSAAEAAIAARRDMIQRFEAAISAAGLGAQCSANCGDEKSITWRTYRLTGANEPLWAALRLADVEPAPSDPIRDSVLGFTPSWQSSMLTGGEGATTHAFVISRSEPNDFDKGNYGHVSVIAWNNPSAQKVLREMTKDGRWLFAWNFFNDQQVAAWKGRLFIHKKDTQMLSDRANLIDYEILE